MSAIPNLSGRVDPIVESTIRDLYSRVNQQQASTNSALASLPKPQTLAEISRALSAGGPYAINVTGLSGLLANPQNARVVNNSSLPPNGSSQSQNGTLFTINNQLFYYQNGQAIAVESIATVLYDTHANRLANYLAGNYVSGTLFYETDRGVLYVDSGTVWLYATGIYEAGSSSRPTDLTTNDVNFLFLATDLTVVWAWTGSVWTYEWGVYSAATGSRPGSLGTNDAHFLFIDTTQKILEQWTGSAWVTIGQGTSLVLAFSDHPGNYTVLSTDFQVVSTNTGTAIFTLPDATTVPGQIYAIKNSSTSTSVLTITPFGSQTIDGNSGEVFNPGGGFIIGSDGTGNWNILAIITAASAGPWTSYTPAVTGLSGSASSGAWQLIPGTTKSYLVRFKVTGTGTSSVFTISFPFPVKTSDESFLVAIPNIPSISIMTSSGSVLTSTATIGPFAVTLAFVGVFEAA